MVAVCVGVSAAGCASVIDIDDDENVLLFPTFAIEDGPSSWVAHIRGWVFEPTVGERRLAQLGEFEMLLRHTFGVRQDELEPNSAGLAPHFAERAGMFRVDNERGHRLTVTIAGDRFALGGSDHGGHFQGDIRLRRAAGRPGEWTEVRVVTKPEDPRIFAGQLQFIGRHGISVVSDIDDTIKVSDVHDRRELGANTFLRAFRATPHMAELYRSWQARGTFVFHYVSGSPFQLYPALADFTRRQGFPAGSFHLRKFRLADHMAAEFFGDPQEFKLAVIDRLIRQFPDRRFILVGDSGEDDPKAYADLAARFPNQVVAILIRDVSSQNRTSPRVVELFASLPAHIERRVFSDARDLQDLRIR